MSRASAHEVSHLEPSSIAFSKRRAGCKCEQRNIGIQWVRPVRAELREARTGEGVSHLQRRHTHKAASRSPSSRVGRSGFAKWCEPNAGESLGSASIPDEY